MGSSLSSFTFILLLFLSLSVNPKDLYTLSPITPLLTASVISSMLFLAKFCSSIFSKSILRNNPNLFGKLLLIFSNDFSKYIPLKPLKLTIYAIFIESISSISFDKSFKGISN